MTPKRHSASSSSTSATASANRTRPGVMACPPSRACDSSRSNCHSRAVISPKRGLATTRLPRSSPQPVAMISSMRPGRADITPMRSAEHRGFVERMGDQQDGGAGLAPQPQQLVAHQEARLLVERAERLVEQDHARPLHQRAREADALAHAAGELHRIGGGELRQAHQPQRVVDARRDLGLVERRLAQAERDVVGDGEPGKARVLLEHDADALRHLARNRLAFNVTRALGRAVQPGDDLEQRGFPAARRADHGEELAAHQIEVDRPERLDLGVAPRSPERRA